MAGKIRQNGFMTTERALHLLFTVFRNAHLTTMQFLLKSYLYIFGVYESKTNLGITFFDGKLVKVLMEVLMKNLCHVTTRFFKITQICGIYRILSHEDKKVLSPFYHKNYFRLKMNVRQA